MEARPDILVYTSEPFTEGVELSGPIEPTLYVSSDAKDTDFTVKVIDVYPDGRAYNLDESIQRLRYRDGYDKPLVWMEPGKVVKVTLQPLTTSNYFAPGHRLRIEVSSSNFPRFDRNLNTGGNNYDVGQGRGRAQHRPSLEAVPVEGHGHIVGVGEQLCHDADFSSSLPLVTRKNHHVSHESTASQQSNLDPSWTVNDVSSDRDPSYSLPSPRSSC